MLSVFHLFFFLCYISLWIALENFNHAFLRETQINNLIIKTPKQNFSRCPRAPNTINSASLKSRNNKWNFKPLILGSVKSQNTFRLPTLFEMRILFVVVDTQPAAFKETQWRNFQKIWKFCCGLFLRRFHINILI